MSCAGNTIISTPNIDRIAKAGVRFTDSNCTQPVCTPSRTSILTGKSACNTGAHDNAAADLTNNPGPSFDNILHDQGYHSRYHGKWHSPYGMASTYDNKVATVANIPGAPREHAEWMAFMDKRSPKRPQQKGEAFDIFYNRPYVPYPVDLNYGDAIDGKMPGDRGAGQDQVYGVVQVAPEATATAYTTSDTLDALETMKDGPFSLTCSIGPPHPPFLVIDRYASMFPFEKMPLPVNMVATNHTPYPGRVEAAKRLHDPAYLRQFISLYCAMVKEVDDHIGMILDKLDEIKLADNTLIVFTADHGEMLGSHGMASKMSFYNEAVQVPLLMRFPGRIKAGTVVNQPVSGLDLFPTILDYMGVQAPLRDGYSLRSCIEGKGQSGTEYRVSEWNTRNVPNYMIRTADWKLMMANSPDSHAVDALYDIKHDPWETNNLLATGNSKDAAKADEMKQLLLTWLKHVNSPDVFGVTARHLG
jgi:arylsulfatase A-like enzyme